MQKTELNLKNIHWNGIHITIPKNWEVIVHGKGHLLFEEDFEPQLELRWTSSSQPSLKLKNNLIKNLKRELKRPVLEVSGPKGLNTLSSEFETSWLSWIENKEISGALSFNKKSGTLLQVIFHQHYLRLVARFPQLLTSIKCHQIFNNDHMEPWTIQDLTYRLPTGYTLQHYNVAAGYTQLTYSRPRTLLHVCRLATAAERLKNQSMLATLGTLLEKPLVEDEVESSKSHVLYHHRPSIIAQIFIRLKRQKPFRWAKIWHCPESDRLLVLIIESIRPIATDQAKKICETYEIF